jgi:hypothetical protein
MTGRRSLYFLLEKLLAVCYIVSLLSVIRISLDEKVGQYARVWEIALQFEGLKKRGKLLHIGVTER